MKESETTLLRTRVDKNKLRQAEDVFNTLGLKSSDAVNLFLAQVALRKDFHAPKGGRRARQGSRNRATRT